VTEAERVTALIESVVSGERTAGEVSDILEINLGLIERVAERMTEQRLGVPARPPDELDRLLRETVLPSHAPEMGVNRARKTARSCSFQPPNGHSPNRFQG
jgi:hypothetical protein